MKKISFVLFIFVLCVGCQKSEDVMNMSSKQQYNFSVNFDRNNVNSGEWVKMLWKLEGFDSIEIVQEYPAGGMIIKDSIEKNVHVSQKSGYVYVTAYQNTTYLVTVRSNDGLTRTLGKILYIN